MFVIPKVPYILSVMASKRRSLNDDRIRCVALEDLKIKEGIERFDKFSRAAEILYNDLVQYGQVLRSAFFLKLYAMCNAWKSL